MEYDAVYQNHRQPLMKEGENMSLTNDQITAQNFKDFYDGIRPYLNGQVPTFANAFSRSDIYTPDEKIVSVWQDGLPIYRKRVKLPDQSAKNTSTELNLSTVIPNIAEAVLPTHGYAHYRVGGTGDTPFVVPGWAGNDYALGFITNGLTIIFKTYDFAFSFFDIYAYVYYTKTGDTPIKVGTGNDYSTDEQIVGSWIDGKPLYQKTVELGTLPNNSTKSVAHGISNLNEIVEIKGIVKSGTTFMQLGKPSTSDIHWSIELEVAGNNVAVTTGSDRTSWTGVCTLKYTKTTD